MMKKNELIDKIKNDIQQSTPDVYSKIKLDQIKVEPYQDKEMKQRKFRVNYKYALSSLMSLVLIFVIVVLIIKPGENITPPVYDYSPLDSSEEVYAVSSLVATNLYLATFTSGDTVGIKNSNNEMLINAEYDNLNKVLNSIESLITDQEKNNIIQLESDDDDYEFLLEINSIDLMKFESTYYLYYNIIDELNLSPVKYGNSDKGSGKDKDDDYDEKDLDDYIDEQNDILEDIEDLDESVDGTLKLTIKGKIKFKNNADYNYSVNGRIVENNNIEKIIFDVSLEENSNDFIRVIQSKHKNKQIFIFKEYVGNSLNSKNYMSLKADKDGNYSADLIVLVESTKLISKYEISKNVSDNEIEVEYIILLNGEIEKGEIEIGVIKISNQYQYNYKTKNDKGSSEHRGSRFRFNNDTPPIEGPIVFINY